MIVKTHAVVVRIIPFSETSRVVLWLTREYGKIAAIIKGAQRRRSQFLGQVDLFYTCELLFYPGRFHGLHIVKECFPLNTRDSFRSRWRAAACASYFSGLVAQISPLNAAHPELFDLLESALDYFAGQSSLETGIYWFELKLLQSMGLSPQLARCVLCHTPLAYDPASAGQGEKPYKVPRRPRISNTHGGILCAPCANSHARGIDGAPVAQDVLCVLRSWQASRSWRLAQSARCTPGQKAELRRILRLFLQYHLEVDVAARDMALATLGLDFSA